MALRFQKKDEELGRYAFFVFAQCVLYFSTQVGEHISRQFIDMICLKQDCTRLKPQFIFRPNTGSHCANLLKLA